MKKYIGFILIAVVLAFEPACKKEEEKSSEKEIVSFAVEEQLEPAIINSGQGSVTLLVADTTNLTSVVPEITISEKASIEPQSGDTIDFSSDEAVYTVTAEDNTTKEWHVSITNELSSGAEILAFRLTTFQVGEAIFNGQDISLEVYYGVNLAALKPIIEISNNATISPESEIITNFTSGSVVYTVTAQDGTEKIWTAHVTYALNYQADIVSFTIPEQIGETQISSQNIHVDVPYGTDISTLTPAIEVSYGATITPASGVTVDFSENGSVEYTVTSENGETTKIWTAQVHFPLTTADNPKFQYVGRWDFSDPSLPRVWSSGAYIMAKFSGTYCEISLVDEVLYNSNYNYLEIVIDGTQNIRTRTNGANNIINISGYLSPGEHTLLICKATESEMGYLEFKGLHLESGDALLTPDPLPERKIEFIGNSITVGSNLDISEGPCTTEPWFFNHNAYFSYGILTAQSLSAQWHITAKSGIGMIHSCCDMTYTMPDIYSTTEVQLGGSSWDFSQYVPDVVTICLGQNDGTQDSTTFCSAYVDFINTQIRSNYPDASIILLNSPMADNSLNAMLVEYTSSVAAYFNGQGDANVYSFEVSHNLNNGCGSHPDLAQHEIIASALSDYIQSVMGW